MNQNTGNRLGFSTQPNTVAAVPLKAKISPVFVFLFIADIILILAINPPSILAASFYFVVTLLVARLALGRSEVQTAAKLFIVFTLLAIILALVQYSIFPSYAGFSGPEGGGGTDDGYYYSTAAPVLPVGMPVRIDYQLRDPNFGIFLRLFSYPIYYITGQIHPLDLILIDMFCLTLIPLFTRQITLFFTNDNEAIAKTAFLLAATCPVLMTMGLVILRDIWACMLLTASLYFLIRKIYIPIIGCIIFLVYIRPDAGIMLLFFFVIDYGVFFLKEKLSFAMRFTSILLLIGVLVVSVTIAIPAAINLLEARGIGGDLFRAEFASDDLAYTSDAENSTATFYRITTLNVVLRVPLATAFMLGSPFFTWTDLEVDGHFIPRTAIEDVFAIMFALFYCRYLIQGILAAWRDRNVYLLVTIFELILAYAILGQVSLQWRHKAWLMPLFYIPVAYGWHNQTKFGKLLGILVSIALVGLNLFVTFLKV